MYLNLTDGFNPLMAEDKDIIKFENFIFPGGEPHIKLRNQISNSIIITIQLNKFEDVGLLLMAVNALREVNKDIKISLFIPYFPGARQDRLMMQGEPFSSKVYANLINSLNLDLVTFLDIHSNVSGALINNSMNITNNEFVLGAIEHIYKGNSNFEDNMLLVSPRSGAYKNMNSLASYLGYIENPIIHCDRHLNIETGKYSNYNIFTNDLEGNDCIIVDDICDDENVFIELAEELIKKGAGKLYLLVTHGIFRNGFDKLDNVYEQVYYSDSFVSKYSNELYHNMIQLKMENDFKYKDEWSMK